MNRIGVTLVELLIVMIIVGVLAAIAIPLFARTKQQVEIALMRSDLRVLETAEDAYFADAQGYATATSCHYPAPAGSALWCVSAGNVLGAITTGTGTQAGWTVSVTNVNVGLSCAMYVGTVTPAAPATARDAEGVPICR